jgi:hypothetical protein
MLAVRARRRYCAINHCREIWLDFEKQSQALSTQRTQRRKDRRENRAEQRLFLSAASSASKEVFFSLSRNLPAIQYGSSGMVASICVVSASMNAVQNSLRPNSGR